MKSRSWPFAAALMAASAIATSAAAAAAPEAGDIQIKAMATMVDVDGGITSVVRDRIPLPARADTKADTAYVPTVAAEYFVTPNISVETYCCVSRHDVTGTGSVKGVRLIDNAEVIPATVTLKYHFPLENGVKPYVGAGGSYFIFFGEGLGAGARGLGATSADLSNELGAVIQAGIDVPLKGMPFGLSLDVKQYFIDTTARFDAGATTVLKTKHKLDPLVVSAGLAWRF